LFLIFLRADKASIETLQIGADTSSSESSDEEEDTIPLLAFMRGILILSTGSKAEEQLRS